MQRFLIILCGISAVLTQRVCRIPQDDERIDCHPEPNANEQSCKAKGCCWKDPLAETNSAVPSCYFPDNYNTYTVTGMIDTSYGTRYQIRKTEASFLPNEILSLNVDIMYISDGILRIRITDAVEARYEVPYVFTKGSIEESQNKILTVTVNRKPFSIKVAYKISQMQIFDTSVGPLLYSDQFIQFSTKIANNFLYGLGEHRNPLKYSTSWQTLAFWAKDQPPTVAHNLYGSQPFAMFIDKTGYSYGMFLLNSNAMDAVIQPSPAITFRTVGGIIDLFIYAGPTPEEVIKQHWYVIETPYFQPYWASGFHLCKYGYADLNEMEDVINRMNSTQFPYDAHWTDIDTMQNGLVFTYNKEKWNGLPEVIAQLHENSMRYIPVNDPCIGSVVAVGQYPTLDEALMYDIFIKDHSGNNLLGQVWPGDCYFPDFTNPAARTWWKNEMQKFNDVLPFDGLWLDMNEPANFVDGSVTGCSNTSLDNPWYVPKVAGGTLYSNTVCPSAKQFLDNHYNLHNMYGFIEAMVSSSVLEELNPNKRHFVLTRSNFAGTGRYAAHWSGDNFSKWKDMYYSIPEIINYNMFGMPFVGSDICGFFENTTEELCMRWMQLGAFYPFMRNNNGGKEYVLQDPAAWSDPVRTVMKSALLMRYRLMPYWYTINFKTSLNEMMTIQPLFFPYHEDKNTFGLDTQFMIGNAIMVAPVLEPGASHITIYFPNDKWYTFPNGEIVSPLGLKSYPVEPESLFLFVRAGYIIPLHILQSEDYNLEKNRQSYFELFAVLKDVGDSAGDLYWDDGITINGNYSYAIFGANKNSLWIRTLVWGHREPMYVDRIRVIGLTSNQIDDVTFGGISQPFTVENKVLTVENLRTDFNRDFAITLRWNYL